MGDFQVGSPQANGFLTTERLSSPSLSSSSSSSDPHPLSIDEDCWLRAEQTTQGIIRQIQPTLVSEQRRKEVIDYVLRLIRGYLGIEVFPFGSVPLKTYLPDGDIDLTALSRPNVEDALANDIRAVLKREEQNKAAEFEVKDVQYIHAEVKLLKCLVQNIVVDISFNQLGGLSTLCFLEEVDYLIGKEHLFKRSIILLKAWCYYESRILGAHHGLISTYALETLVLYIFHRFHSSLNGPLAVLYKFLDFFSTFDWDKYCISLNGLVCISSLPELVDEAPENGGGDLLISKEFLRYCVDTFSVPSRGLETNSRAFPKKHFNIVDPLKENNNLGRSVSKGNFYRIRSAFTYGARKLGRILLLPGESIADELNKFFMNTLDRHGSRQRPDVQDLVPSFGANGSGPPSSYAGTETCTEDKSVPESPSVDSSGIAGESRFDPQGLLCEGISNVRLSGTEKKPGSRIPNDLQKYSTKVVPSAILLEANCSTNGNSVSGCRLAGDAKDLATSRIQGLRITSETPIFSPPSSEVGATPLEKAHHSPHFCFSRLSTGNGKIGNRDPDQKNPANCGIPENKMSSTLLQLPNEETGSVLLSDPDENHLVTNNTIHSCSNHEDITSVGPKDGLLISSPVAYSEDLCLGYTERDSAGTAGSLETPNLLSDLNGDYHSHFQNLAYGKWWHEYAWCAPVVSIPPPLPSQFRNNNTWDSVQRSVQLKQNAFSHMNAHSVIQGPPFYPGNPPIISGAAFSVEEMPKPRGTGTYFPNTNHHSYRERPSPGRGRNQAPVPHGQLQRSPHTNGRAVTSPETNLLERGSHELPLAQFPIFPGRGRPGLSDFLQSGHPDVRGFPHNNGLSLSSDRLEFGTFRHLPLKAPSLEGSRQPVSGVSPTQGSNLSLPTLSMPSLNPVLGINQERVAVQSYHLKDEDDFPPLST